MAMAASGCSSSVHSLPPPHPKSPPEYPDLYGKRRQLVKVQMLEREIGSLEEELKSIEGLHPASRCCKEVADFVVTNSDPLIPTSQKIRRSCRFWKWLCGPPCFIFSWNCCYGCCPRLEVPDCCNCSLCNCCSCANCSIPSCKCCCWPSSKCFSKISCSCSFSCSCSRSCCILQCPTCPDCCFCSIPKCSCPKCPKVRLRSCCTKRCCFPCYLCC